MKPSKDFKLDYNRKQIKGYVYTLDELKQSNKLALEIPRLEYLIYSHNFGSELEKLIGKDYDYVLGKVRPVIIECLMVDERVISVDDFIIERNKDTLSVSFTVRTVFGDYIERKELSLNGV